MNVKKFPCFYLSALVYLLFISKPAAAEVISEAMAERLGWVPDTLSVCHGSYQEPPLLNYGIILPELREHPVHITGTQGIFQKSGQSTLGKALITQPGRLISGNQAFLNRDEKTGQFTSADLRGNVVLREPGKLILSETAHLELQTKKGDLQDAWYRLLLDKQPPMMLALPNGRNQLRGLVARGQAYEVKQLAPGLMELRRATYTTCAPDSKAWQLLARRIDLNRETGRGTARDAKLLISGIPVFYTPYFNFPIDKRRQSGFLFPTYGSSSTGGINFSFPYYWNIAPNYDATITPHVFVKRGLQINGLFRYLTEHSKGEIHASVLPNDVAFSNFQKSAAIEFANNPSLPRLLDDNANRALFSLQNSTVFNEHWHGQVNYTAVTDDYYFQDFNTIPFIGMQNQLIRQGNLAYSGENWNFQGLLQTYQTLHPVNQPPLENPYSRLPQLSLSSVWPSESSYGLTYTLDSEFSYFSRALAPGEVFPSPNGQPTAGGRTHLQPGISWPFLVPAGYFIPNLQLLMTHYNLTDQRFNYPETITRTLPVFNIDSGLYFDRHVSFLGSGYQQTLEPRLYYLNVPFKSQFNIPIFDSASQPFSYDQLFRNNRFTGLDRIGDANQLSYAITTRFLDDDHGSEKFRASMGQILYFENRRVGLCSTPNCKVPQSSVGTTSPTEKSSPLTGQLSYNFSRLWNATANMAYDPNTHNAISGGLNFQYQLEQNQLLNFGYNYVQNGDTFPGAPPGSSKNNLSQTNFSFAWPIRQNWHVMGGLNYNISHQHTQTFFYGVEYNSCCWAFRVATGRTFSGLNGEQNPTYNKQIYLQFQLKGFGNIGNTDTSSALTAAIPGYVDNFGRAI